MPPPANKEKKPHNNNRYLKWGALALLIPFLIWGASKFMSQPRTIIPEEKPSVETPIDKTEKQETEPTKPEPAADPQKIAQQKAQQTYDAAIVKGDGELKKSPPNYQTAQSYYDAAIKAAKGFDITTTSAKKRIDKCKNEIATQSAAKKEHQVQLAAERQRKTEEDAWNTAKKANTMSAYQTYQQKYQNGKYYSDASNQIDKLKAAAVAAAANTNAGTFKDSRDGQTYKWERLKDGKKWMAHNLNFKMGDSWCYEDKDSNCGEYGRLYNWAAAKKACPSGWRLPSEEEWWTMAGYYGKAYNSRSGHQENTSDDAGKVAYKILMKEGSSGFSAQLGGDCNSDGEYSDIGGYGPYWSGTEYNSSNAWYYYFSRDDQILYRNYNLNTFRFACRCVQD